MMLEQLKHNSSSFLTLTYDQEHLPNGATLVPKHAQDWLKRLRKLTSLKLRYFLVGEYGDDTQRPHYHAALFGMGPEYSEIVRQTWGRGHIMLGDLTKDSAQYIAGYVTKKMTDKADPRLKGRHPEFARMSLRPGIGALAIEDIALVLTTDHGCDEILNTGDVPQVLMHGSKRWPLGRYLRKKLREHLGFPETGGQEDKIKVWSMQMHQLLENLKGSEAWPKNPQFRRDAVKKLLLEFNKQRVLNMESKNKIFTKKGQL